MFTEESLLLTLQYIAYIFLLPPAVILLLDRVVQYLARDAFGVYQATGIVGAPIHELSHAGASLRANQVRGRKLSTWNMRVRN